MAAKDAGCRLLLAVDEAVPMFGKAQPLQRKAAVDEAVLPVYSLATQWKHKTVILVISYQP